MFTDPKLLNSSIYCNTKFIFWINTVLFNFWFIKESWKSIKGPKKYVSNIDYKSVISEGSCDTED